jgi:GH25 family lysozyme M1 (1,4-beta-N-acetylmuramidase)
VALRSLLTPLLAAVLMAVLTPGGAVAAAPEVPGDGGWAGHAGAPADRAEAGSALTVGSFPVTGIDVSSHDHSVHPMNWPAIAASGTKFAYIKATEGHTYTNPHFTADFEAAKASGMFVGAYAFGRPDRGDPIGQADSFIDQAKWAPDPATLIPFLDIEWPYGALHLPACWGLTPAQMSSWIRQFLQRVTQRIGRLPMIYTNTNWWNPCTGSDATFGAYPLDIAGYTSSPPRLPAGWSTFAIWQHAAGRNTEAGNYDKDVFNGDLPALQGFAGPRPTARGALQSVVNGRYVCAEHAGAAPLVANRSAIGGWETFDLVDAGGGYTALRSQANSRYVSAESAGAAPLVASRLSIGVWEKFELVPNRDGSVSLKSAITSRFVTAGAGGAQPLIANRPSIGPWEKFRLIPR